MKLKIAVILILILGAVLRLIGLSHFPAGLNADEAALGYNAYSLMLTGKDEHGHPWPINLESFGDFKPAFYSYMLIPFIKVLGLTELAVRLPSALFGIAAVWFIYLLAKELTDSRIGLISAFLLAVAPWHLHFSRGGWEVNVAITMLLAGTWAFLKWTKNLKIINLTVCILAYALSMYTYQSARLLAPLLGIGLVLIYRKTLMAKINQSIVALIALVLLLIPLGYTTITSDAGSRLAGVGLLADEGPVNRANELRGQHINMNSFPSRIMHNRVVGYSIAFLKNYMDHFSGDFLFVNGDVIQRNKIPETGLLYLTDLIFIIAGIIYLLRKSNNPIVWLWLVISPIAAAITFQTPHALRAFPMVIPLTLITAAGLNQVICKWKYFAIGVIGIIYVWQITRYLHQYYVHYPQTYPAAWEYGFSEAIAYAEANKSKYDSVLVTTKYDQPYILFLFYSKFDPSLFQGNHQLTVRDKFNFSTVNAYDKYLFTNTNWDKVSDMHPTLIIAAPEDIPQVGVNIVKTIYFPNGRPAFKIVSN
jgi:4-amino-4-deoxy-L-arabinose transferase-like glycosyltransferase